VSTLALNSPSLVARTKRRAKLLAVAWRDLALIGFDGLIGMTSRAKLSGNDVLIVRMDALGDFVLWLNAARAIRLKYRDRRVVLWCDESVCELARHVELFDEVIGVRPRRFRTELRYRAKMIRRLRAHRFGTVLHPVHSREGDFADGESLVHAARSAEKISFRVEQRTRGWRGVMSDRWYTHLLPTSQSELMELRRNADFVRGLGVSDFMADVPKLSSNPARLDDYFVLFPGAGLAHRRWPISNFIEIARRMHDHFELRGVICGGPSERGIGESLRDALPEILENRAGQTSLTDYVALLAGARLVVTNDTSAAHIACATGTPSIVIVGGGEPGRFYPYQIEVPERRQVPLAVRQPMACDGCNWNCIYSIRADEPFPCVAAVTVEQVWNQIISRFEPREAATVSEAR